MNDRIPARLEVSGLVRRVNAAGGFATVLQKGEPDAGTILLVFTLNGGNTRVFERMPQLDGTRKWTLSKGEVADSKDKIEEYLNRRGKQDPDLWIVELDVPDPERFIGLS